MHYFFYGKGKILEMDKIPVRRKEKRWKMLYVFRATAGQKTGSRRRLTQKGAVLRSRLKTHEKKSTTGKKKIGK